MGKKTNRFRAAGMRLEKTTFELNFRWNCSFCNHGDVLRILHWREPASFCLSEASWVELVSLATPVNRSQALWELFKCFEEENRQRKVCLFVCFSLRANGAFRLVGNARLHFAHCQLLFLWLFFVCLFVLVWFGLFLEDWQETISSCLFEQRDWVVLSRFKRNWHRVSLKITKSIVREKLTTSLKPHILSHSTSSTYISVSISIVFHNGWFLVAGHKYWP